MDKNFMTKNVFFGEFSKAITMSYVKFYAVKILSVVLVFLTIPGLIGCITNVNRPSLKEIQENSDHGQAFVGISVSNPTVFPTVIDIIKMTWIQFDPLTGKIPEKNPLIISFLATGCSSSSGKKECNFIKTSHAHEYILPGDYALYVVELSGRSGIGADFTTTFLPAQINKIALHAINIDPPIPGISVFDYKTPKFHAEKGQSVVLGNFSFEIIKDRSSLSSKYYVKISSYLGGLLFSN